MVFTGRSLGRSRLLGLAVTTPILKGADKAEEIVSRVCWQNLPDDKSTVLKAVELLRETLTEVRESAAAAQALRKAVREETAAESNEAGSSPESWKPNDLFAALPAAPVSAQTDADGRCSLKLASGDWLLAARAQRQLPAGNWENYVWIVAAPKSGKATLSNNNLLVAGIDPLSLAMIEFGR